MPKIKRALFPTICKECQQKFMGRKGAVYCSRECFGKGRKDFKMPKDARKKISEGNTGKKRSKEARKKISKALSGSKSYLWKGGITKLNRQIRNLFELRQWRSDIFMRDDFTCQECGVRGCYIEAHHVVSLAEIIKKYKISSASDAKNCAELWNINNGITLCKDCHAKTDNYRGKAAKKRNEL